MIPEELLQQALEEYPEYSHMLDLTTANNYLDANPDGSLEEYIYYCQQIH